MNGIALIATLAKAGIIRPDVTRVLITATADGYLSITTEDVPKAKSNDDEMLVEYVRLRQIEELAGKMATLQLEKGEVDDQLAEQVKELMTNWPPRV